MIVLDTCIIIDALRGNMSALDRLKEQYGAMPVSTTTINVLELYSGAYRSSNPEANLRNVESFLEGMLILNIVDATYDIFGHISAALKDMGTPIGDFDELVAAIALSHGGEILTTDEGFKQVPGLEVITYEC